MAEILGVHLLIIIKIVPFSWIT